MASSLIRGKYVICKVTGRAEAEVIADGAVFQRDGTIVDIGRHRDLAARHRPDEVFGSGEHIVMPGFVNSHHHVGLTPFQLGSPDYPLELWFASRMAARNVDPYLDTLYSAFEMLESGITTVQHLHGSRVGPASTGAGDRRAGAQGLSGHRHAGLVLLFAARPEPARVRGRRRVRQAGTGQPRAGAGGVAESAGDSARGPSGALRGPVGAVERPGADPDPAGPGQPALVLRRGSEGPPGSCAQVRRRDAHASGRNGVPEGVRPAPLQHDGGAPLGAAWGSSDRISPSGTGCG